MSHRVVCLGELLLRLSPPGKHLLQQSRHLEVCVGGAEANVAVSLAHFGHSAALVTCVPDNPLAHLALAELRRHAVDLQFARMGAGRMGLYFLTHGAEHRPAEVIYDRAESAFALWNEDALDWRAVLHGAAWLHLSGITPAVSEAAAVIALQAMSAARSLGVATSFDCNFRSRLWGERAVHAPTILRQLCEQATVIFGDDRDIAFILGGAVDGADAAARYRRAATRAFQCFPRLEWLACTERAVAADSQQYSGHLFSRDGTHRSRAYALRTIVDRIGAGDAFAAGVVHSLLDGRDPQRAIEFGTAAACIKHSIPGDWNLCSVADVERLLSQSSADVLR